MKTKHECRVCLKDGGNIPIFGDDDKPDISLEVTIFGSIQLTKDDTFPKSICRGCYKLLESAISFRKSALHADVVLKRRKQKNLSSQSATVKLEADDNCSEFNIIDVQKPDFLIVNTTENITDIKDENCLEDNSYDDGNKSESNDEDDKNALLIDRELTSQSYECTLCKTCNQSFKSLEEYEEHIMTIINNKNISLEKNKKSRVEKKPLIKMKIKTSNSNNKKECTVCKRMFHPVALNRHMKKAHSNEKDLPKIKSECPICKKLFPKDLYSLHLRTHNKGETKNTICDQCGKKVSRSAFSTHRLIHSNDLPHKCEYCPYRGRTKHLLKIHVRTHTGDYPYKCTQCDIRCLTKSNLNAHMKRQHRGPIDFICDLCSRGYYSKLELQRHISVIHQGIKGHICNLCGMAFGYRSALLKHELRVHKRAKGKVGKPKAVYLKLEEEGMLQQAVPKRT